MNSKKNILLYVALLINVTVFAQYGQQKKADNLFNKFSFANASEVYKELIDKNFNKDYAVRQLADCYTYMRNPDSAVVYYKKAVEQTNVPIEYYYKYAQALRGITNYEESRVWLRKFKEAGGTIDDSDFLKDADFITSVFNARQQYSLKEFRFNSKYSDFGAYEHNRTFYLASSRDEGVSTKHTYGWNNEPFLDIYAKDKKDTTNLDNKSKLKGDVNSVYHEGPITITKEGKTMYFSRNNYNKYGLEKDKNGVSHLKIYKASLKDGKWTDIEELPFNSNNYSIGHPALNADNTKLYFASDMPGGFGGADIYYVDIDTDGSFGSPKNLGKIINTNEDEVFPFVNSEGTLFFSSNGHQGLGLLDVFATLSDEQGIVSVLNLGIPVNSSKDDFSFFMSEDGTTGYFASNRDGGLGSDDIYAYDRVLPLKVEGTVRDAVNSKPIANATVTLFDVNDNQIAFLNTDDTGHYEINIDRDTYYKITGSHIKYTEDSKTFSSKNIAKTTTSITVDLLLNPVQDVVTLAELNTIYFDFEKYNIRPDAAAELDKIVNLMQNEYPDMTIRIESHTDSRGTFKFNDWLSQERAKATYDYLVSKGIDASRIIKYEGFGERRLSNGCDGTIVCSEKDHQLNRRTEFIVIKMK